MTDINITSISILGDEIKITSKSITPTPSPPGPSPPTPSPPTPSPPGPSPDPTKLTPGISSDNIKQYMRQLNQYIGNGDNGIDPAYGSSKDDAINNFVDSVYIWNTFINENNKLSCETVAINNWTGPIGTHVPLKCERASYQGYNYLGILDSMFDSDDDELNKIELALLLGNAWNESGQNNGIFNVCLQTNTPKYEDSLCTCEKCTGYNIKLVGRGLLQLSNPSNYIPVANIMNKMGDVLNGKLSSDYTQILNKLPTGELYPPLCGQKDADGNYIKQCTSADQSDTTKDCCQVPILDTQVQQVCGDIPQKENTIYTNPASICDNHGALSILTSFIYNSANTSMAVKNTGYSFLVSSCSINQGGFLYPIKTTDYDWIVEDSKIKNYLIMTNDQIQDKVNECTAKLEGSAGRYGGFCIIMNLLFPGNNITSTADWSINLLNGKYYRSNHITYDSRLYDT